MSMDNQRKEEKNITEMSDQMLLKRLWSNKYQRNSIKIEHKGNIYETTNINASNDDSKMNTNLYKDMFGIQFNDIKFSKNKFNKIYKIMDTISTSQKTKLLTVKEKRIRFRKKEKYVGKIYLNIERNSMDYYRILNEYVMIKKSNLIGYYDIFYEDNSFIIIMEYYGYDNLDVLYHNNCKVFQYMDKIQIIYEIGLYLSILHGMNICYNDIKPANVIISKNKNNSVFHAFLVDFESILKDNTELNRFLGTIFWVGNNIDVNIGIKHNKKNRYNKCSDIFSFGLLILYIYNNGIQPFKNINDNIINIKDDIRIFNDLMFEYNIDNGKTFYQNIKKYCKNDNSLYDLLINYMFVWDINQRCNDMFTILKHDFFSEIYDKKLKIYNNIANHPKKCIKNQFALILKKQGINK